MFLIISVCVPKLFSFCLQEFVTVPLHMLEFENSVDKLRMFKDLCNTLLSSGVDALALLLWGHQTAPIYKKKLTTDFILEIEQEAGILETVLPVDDNCITIVKKTVLIDVDIRFSPEVYYHIFCVLLYIFCTLLCIL